MLAKDTIADVVVGSAGEEGRVVGSRDSIEDDAIEEEDGTSHVVFVHSEVEWPVVCSSRWGSVAGFGAPGGQSRGFDESDILKDSSVTDEVKNMVLKFG
ncbi:hypothetical protein G7Y79_00043g079590 [Physcia stellaris]|nr:hypothetical protein G7Y79_00043g079590 [Physcia stellaris]